MSDSPPITSFTGEYRFLSNFHTGYPIMLHGITFITAEHFYQWSKCWVDNDRDMVLRTTTPGQAKRAGQQVLISPDWEERKRRVMLHVVTAKFFQHTDLATQLTSTGNRPLIEGNTWGDTYWGVSNGMGWNFLGKTLMVVRSAVTLLREDDKQPVPWK